MKLSIRREHEYRTMPWKNGQGMTREVWVYPEGAALDNFVWRVSCAQVRQAGAFSQMLGIERTLMILHGALRVQDLHAQYAVDLNPQSAPFVFQGSTVIHAEPIHADGVVEDFNVMTRADDCSHLVRRLNVAGTHDEQLIGDFMLIYHERGAPVHINYSSECVLNAGETLLVQRESEKEKIVRLSATPAALIVVHINQIRRTP
jgi:hypothetical protein